MKRILRLLERSDFEKAIEILREELSENRDHAGYLWIAADLVSNDTLPYYHLDSAYYLVKRSLESYDNASLDDLKDFEKIGFDRLLIVKLDLRIKDQHWEEAQKQLSQNALWEFAKKYPETTESIQAAYQVDSLGFEEAIRIGTWQAYLNYQKEYQGSVFSKEAESRYHKLLYEDQTFPESESGLQRFITTYPESPHRNEAVGRLLKYKLFWNDADSLVDFALKNSESEHAQKALNYAYHINPQLINAAIFKQQYLAMDSLSTLDAMIRRAVFLILSERGTEALSMDDHERSPTGLELVIGERAYCSPYQKDFFFGMENGKGRLLQRNGKEIVSGDFVSAEDIGLGTVLLHRANGPGLLIHKTGATIIDDIDHAEIIGNRWIKLKRQNHWALVSLNGQLLCDFLYDEINEIGSFWVFKKDNLFAVSNERAILREAGTGGFTLLFKYDDLELVDDTWMIGFRDNMEGLINQDLAFIIPWGEHVIFPNKEIPYSKSEYSYTIYPQVKGLNQSTYQQVLLNNGWLAVKDTVWKYRHRKGKPGFQQADSVRLIGTDYFFSMVGGDASLHFNEDSILSIGISDQVQFLEVPETSAFKHEQYLVVKQSEKQQTYSSAGQLLFEFENNTPPKPIGDSLFIIADRRGRSGVKQINGEWLLQPRFNFINREGNRLNLVQGNKIGAYLLEDSLFIESRYLSNIQPFGPYYKTATETGVGIIDRQEDEVLGFRYQELEFYNDSLVWVKTDSSWQIQKFMDDQIIQYGIRSFQKLTEPDGFSYKVNSAGGYGILDEAANYIIQPMFSDIRLISNDQNHFYIGEKAVPEAGYYIWVGFTETGDRFFSQAYREEVYDQIACD